MNTSLPVRDPFYSIFAVAAVTVLSIAAFVPAGPALEQVSSHSVVETPLVAHAEPVDASNAH
jgi:hypothetical protein